MIHPTADIQSKKVGEYNLFWQNVVVLPGAEIGSHCNICANCFIENDVKIGNNVTLKCGVCVWDGVTIGDGVFIGTGATFTNDKFPRSKVRPEKFLKTEIKEGATIGANATILPVTIGEHAMIGAGAVVTKDVPPYAIVTGSPGRITGYVDAKAMTMNKNAGKVVEGGHRLYCIPTFSDVRGDLNVIEVGKVLPFEIKRVFYTYNVQSKQVRGEHAHKKCEQFLVAVSGSCNVIVDDGNVREEYVLNSPAIGVHIPAGCWGIQYKHSPDCVLMVLASLPYEEPDYIRDYDAWRKYMNER